MIVLILPNLVSLFYEISKFENLFSKFDLLIDCKSNSVLFFYWFRFVFLLIYMISVILVEVL